MTRLLVAVPYKVFLTIYIAVSFCVMLRCSSSDDNVNEPRIDGSVSYIDSLPRLPSDCMAVTIRDSTLYFACGYPPLLQTRFIQSSEPETIFAFPASSHIVHIAVHDDRIAISDAGMHCIWASMGDSIYSRHEPGIYRKLTPISSAWCSPDSVVVSGFWLSRINERLSVHYGHGFYNFITEHVRFDIDTALSDYPELGRINPVDVIIGNGSDIKTVRLSGNTLTIRPLISSDDRVSSALLPPALQSPPGKVDLTMAGCIFGVHGATSCLVRGNDISVLVIHRNDSQRPMYLSLPEIEPDWRLIGITDDFILWRTSSGEIIRLGPASPVE